jgi:hypothetical protein
MRIIITESDKKRILSLIKESIDTTELMNYANEYIDGHSCDQIYKDLLTYQTAVNNNEVYLSDNDKDTLTDSIDKIKTYKGIACGTIKSTMKKEFSKQASSDPDKLLESMCWFSKNVYVKTLKVCQKPQTNVIDKPITTTKTEPSVNLPSIETPKEKPLEPAEVKVGRIDTISKSMSNLDDLKRYIIGNVNNELKIKNNPPYKINCDGIKMFYDETNGKYTMSVNLEVCEEKDRSWFFTIIGDVGGEINKSLVIDFKGRFKDDGSTEVIECEKTLTNKGKQWSELVLIGDKPINAKLLESRNIYY